MEDVKAMDQVYTGGVPTEPAVRALNAKFPDMEALRGTVITHEQVEAVVGEKRGSTRYRTITSAWRKQIERKTGVVVDGRGEAIGVGFRVLAHGEQIDFGVNQRRSGARKIKRGYNVVASTNEDKLTPEQKRVRDHEIFAAAKINAALMAARRRVGEPRGELMIGGA